MMTGIRDAYYVISLSTLTQTIRLLKSKTKFSRTSCECYNAEYFKKNANDFPKYVTKT